MNTSTLESCPNIIEERQAIAAPGRAIEGVLSYPVDSEPKYSVLVVGPHPLMGGNLDNNVVRALAGGLAANGAVTLAFNYSGVGQSEGGPDDWQAAASQFWATGKVDQERAWIDDANAARKALAKLNIAPMIVVGYSFGCWVTAELPADPDTTRWVLVSPNPNRHRFDGLSKCSIPLLVVHSDNDFASTTEQTRAWFDCLRNPKSLNMLDSAEHFFRGREQALLDTVVQFLESEQTP